MSDPNTLAEEIDDVVGQGYGSGLDAAEIVEAIDQVRDKWEVVAEVES